MKLNPFDPKYFLFAKHAQHVALIHFPIALFVAGVILDFVGVRKNRKDFETAAYFNFWGAALATIPTIASGIAAWQWALEGQRIQGILRLHIIFAAASTFLIWSVLLIHKAARREPNSRLLAYRLAMEAGAFVAIILTGHLGGFLSGVNAVG